MRIQCCCCLCEYALKCNLRAYLCEIINMSSIEQQQLKEENNKKHVFILSNGLSKTYLNDLKKASIKNKFLKVYKF